MQLITNDKHLLRKQLIKKRKQIPLEQKNLMDELVFDALINLENVKNAEIILTYVSTAIETDTLKLIEWAISESKIVGVPITFKNHISFYKIGCLNELKITDFGILEPNHNDITLINNFDNSICIIPALAYDNNGFRLGYGKGYYDKFLSVYNGMKIGVCYKDFIMKIPVDKHDVFVDIVITD